MRVAVFGHYDSRGGTTAMPFPSEAADDAANLKVVKRQYDMGIWGEEVANAEPIESRPSEQDFLFITELIGAEDVDDNADLDSGRADGSDHAGEPGKGTWVIAPPGSGTDDDFIQADPAMLVVVPSGFLPTGWVHPRWDDDAYGFLLGVS